MCVQTKRERKRERERECKMILSMLCVLPEVFISNILLKNIENVLTVLLKNIMKTERKIKDNSLKR